MLSRDAEHLYWLARYIERAENTGRLINVNVEMMLDFPTDKSLGWEPILEAMNSKDAYLLDHKNFNESDVIHYLSREKNNPNSIASCLSFASYNSEFIKDDLPRSAVEELNNNEMNFLKEMTTSVSKRKRAKNIYEVISSSQRFFGIISDNFSRGYAFEFLRLGRFIERADMITRIVDSICTSDEKEGTIDLSTLEWVNLLKTLSAHQAYRKVSRGEIIKDSVIGFLFKDDSFPRSIFRCLTIIKKSFQNLPQNDEALLFIDKFLENLKSSRIGKYDNERIHVFIDSTQKKISTIDQLIQKSYFNN